MWNRSRSRFSSSARSTFASFASGSSARASAFTGQKGPGLFSSSAKAKTSTFGSSTPFASSLPRNVLRNEKRGFTFAQREFILDSLGRPLVVSGVVQFGSLTLGELLEEEEDEEGRVTTSGS